MCFIHKTKRCAFLLPSNDKIQLELTCGPSGCLDLRVIKNIELYFSFSRDSVTLRKADHTPRDLPTHAYVHSGPEHTQTLSAKKKKEMFSCHVFFNLGYKSMF